MKNTLLKTSFFASTLFSLMALTFTVNAGGNPDMVKFPDNYKSTFKQYHEMNRAGKPLVAVLYANQAALDKVGSGGALEDAIVIMEVYKAEMDAAGKPVMGENGVYKKGKFAAVAVMENQSWGDSYPASERSGDWGFAIYNPDGSAKANNLDCASCHTPFKETDYLYTFKQLTGAK